MGDVGSELPLEGSVVDPGLGEFKYIPKDQWEESEYGCYYFVVDVTQSEPWSARKSNSFSYFLLYLRRRSTR